MENANRIEEMEASLLSTRPLRAAWLETSTARAALCEEALVSGAVDGRRAGAIARASYVAVEPLLVLAEQATPRANLALIREIPLRADALIHAETLVVTEEHDEGPLPEQIQEGLAMRAAFYADLSAAARRGHVDPRRLAGLTRLPGARNVGKDLGIMAEVSRDGWHTLEGRCAITREEIERAERLSTVLVYGAGARDFTPPDTSHAAEDRRRALTLLVMAYEEAKRVVAYLRRREGDAAEITPSLYGYPGAHRETEEEVDEGAKPATAPAASTPAPAAPSPAPESAHAKTAALPSPFGPPDAPGASRLDPFSRG